MSTRPRGDLDTLAAQILLGFGFLNSAALAAALSNQHGFEIKPFIIGLISAIFSQLWWYVYAALEYTFQNDNITKTPFEEIFEFIARLFIIGGGAVSATCLVIGCFKLVGFSEFSSLFLGIIICIIPLLALFFFGFKISKRL